MKTSASDISYIASKVKNIPRKLKREFYKMPPVQAMQENAYQKALNAHSQFLPQLDPQGKSIVETLREEGTCIIPIEELGLSTTNMMMGKALYLANNLRQLNLNANTANACELGSSPEDLRKCAETLLWALEPKLLDIVENYIGLPILYQFFSVRRSLTDGKYSGVRRWHIDWEDNRIIKIIIYLNDVAAGGGPYEYISRGITSEATKKLNYHNLGYVSDETMATVVPRSDWTTCLAQQGSVIISDTRSVFHRAQPPTDEERFSISFCYTSTAPEMIWRGSEVSQQQWEFIDNQTNWRQKNCLDKKRFAKFM
jgi:hypothetical protein